MSQVGGGTSVALVAVYNPQSRARTAPAFTWRYLLRTALNVARTVEALHVAGYVVGDLNESNLLVDRRARVSLVDCDSIQVRDPATGEVFPCPVGRPEYLAPELHGEDLSTVERTESADAFALAVLVFHLLLEGRHPYAGRWRGAGEPPDIAARMRMGAWPFRRLDPRVGLPPLGLPLSVLPWRLRRLVRRTFGAGGRRPDRRPSVGEWADALEAAEAGLRTCRRSQHHVVPHGRRCPWCSRVDAGLPDPFPGPGGSAVAPRRRAGWVRQAREEGLGLWSHVRPYLARTFPLAAGAAVAGAAWPIVAPLAVSLAVLPLLASLAGGRGAGGVRRRFDPRRGSDAVVAVARSFGDAVRAGMVVGASAAGAAVTASLAVWAVLGGALWPVVQAASVAVTVGQLLLAPQVVEAWTPVAERWAALGASRPRLASFVAWTVAAVAVAAAARY
jgi:hypothetical protein